MDERRGKFISLGKKRIKIGNIKNYGISSSMINYEKIYKPIEHSRRGLARLLLGNTDIELVWEGEMEKLTKGRYELFRYQGNAYERYRNKEGKIVDSNLRAYMDSVVEKEVKYLYITTFQKDNFVFYEDEVEFNIFDKCKELDNLLCI